MSLDDDRALIGRLFPELVGASVVAIEGGWTCSTYLVNGEWIVQLPRSDHAAERLRAQIAMLPELAREVSAPIPLPELVSDEPVCMGYRRIEGVPCTSVSEGLWPERLGRFLYDLHMVPPEFVGLRSTTAEDVRRLRRRECAELVEAVGPLLAPAERARADRLVDEYLGVDQLWRFAPCLIHADLGPEHVLVSDDGDLRGVIDWEEAGLGDPAGDLAWWLHELPDQAERALAAYGGEPDATFRERARYLWALMPWHEVVYGLQEGGTSFVESGLEGVRARLL